MLSEGPGILCEAQECIGESAVYGGGTGGGGGGGGSPYGLGMQLGSFN